MTCLICCERLKEGEPVVTLSAFSELGEFDKAWTGYIAHATHFDAIGRFHYADMLPDPPVAPIGSEDCRP